SLHATFVGSRPGDLLHPPSFPTRRSSDLDDDGDQSLPQPFVLGSNCCSGGRDQRCGLVVELYDRLVVALAHSAQFGGPKPVGFRSEEHTSELQSRENLVCRLLLEKKKQTM